MRPPSAGRTFAGATFRGEHRPFSIWPGEPGSETGALFLKFVPRYSPPGRCLRPRRSPLGVSSAQSRTRSKYCVYLCSFTSTLAAVVRTGDVDRREKGHTGYRRPRQRLPSVQPRVRLLAERTTGGGSVHERISVLAPICVPPLRTQPRRMPSRILP